MEALITLFFALAASAFFSGMEIAFLTANRLHVEIQAKKGSLSGRILPLFYARPSAFIATMLLGNTVSLVLVGGATAILLNDPLSFLGSPFLIVAVQTLLSTVVVLFLAEYLPKAFFRERANASLEGFSGVLLLVFFAFAPIVFLFTSLSQWTLRRLGDTQGTKKGPLVFGKADLDHFISERSESEIHSLEPEVALFRNALEFADTRVKSCMLPRNEIEAISADATLEEVRQRFISTGYSKLVVYRHSIDDAFAYIHAYALFQSPKTLASVITPVSFLPETTSAQDVFKQLVKEKRSVALVVDELGVLVGLVTLEDLIEELFGEIDDEHDTQGLLERQIASDEWHFSARHDVSYVNEQYGLRLPESEVYNSLGGMIVDQLGYLPEKGESLSIGSYTLEVTAVKANRVEEVRIKA